jgi:hypothetical protein
MERGGEALTSNTVIARLDRATQYSRALIFEHPRSGILGHPLEPVIGRRAAPTRWRVVTAEIGVTQCFIRLTR